MSPNSGIGWTPADLRNLCYSKRITERCLGWGVKVSVELGTTAVVALLLTSVFFSVANYGFAVDFRVVTEKRMTSLLFIYGVVTMTVWNELSCFTTSKSAPEEREAQADEATDSETEKEEQETVEETTGERRPVEKEA